jgi:alcohol dehydrogenase class IV
MTDRRLIRWLESDRAPVVVASERRIATLPDRLAAVVRKSHVTRIDPPTPPLEWADIVERSRLLHPESSSILAIGGGTAIDLGKALSAINPTGPLLRFPTRQRTKLAFVPTVAGTGAEATPFYTYFEDGTKFSAELQNFEAHLIQHSPALLTDLPLGQICISALDAFSQLIESAISRQSTDETIKQALCGLTLLVDTLPTLLVSRSRRGFGAMLEAAYISGQCIRITKTNLAHAISYPMTGHFNVPHGLACALLLPSVFRYVCRVAETRCIDPRGSVHLHRVIERIKQPLNDRGFENIDEFVGHSMGLAGLPRDLDANGIEPRHHQAIVEDALRSNRLGGSPVALSDEDLREILQDCNRSWRPEK